MKTCKSSVFITKFSELNNNQFANYVNKLGLNNKLSNASSIIIKVNLSAGDKFKGTNPVVTNRKVLDFVLHNIILINSKAQIKIVESDSIGMSLAPSKFAFQDYSEITDQYRQVELVNLSRSSLEKYNCTGLHFKNGILLPKIVATTDFFISLAKIKTHTKTNISGILKNQFGCLSESNKDIYHPYLPKVITDINSVIKPDLCILDGCPAMEGSGPIHGLPVQMDLLIIGNDPVAVDATMARVMGMNPEKINTLKMANLHGLGNLKEQEIIIEGLSIDLVKRNFKFISKEQQIYIHLGLFIQRIGMSIYNFGHFIHSIQGTFWAIRKIIKKIFRKVS